MPLTGIETKLLLIGADIASDVIMDIYFDMKSKGQETITADDILAHAARWKSLKSEEMAKVEARIEARKTDPA